ncbi:MAG TPA: hypothetical protein VMM92_13580, partial [Thermoanaerobaculia bacterium]|nr:hypothetical protein [Thermoanaerobaculia bacterium]
RSGQAGGSQRSAEGHGCLFNPLRSASGGGFGTIGAIGGGDGSGLGSAGSSRDNAARTDALGRAGRCRGTWSPHGSGGSRSPSSDGQHRSRRHPWNRHGGSAPQGSAAARPARVRQVGDRAPEAQRG